jgi:tRNA-dihydrouridine synthase
LAKQYALDGIMVGRGIFKDPFVFSAQDSWQTFTPTQKLEMYKDHVELFQETWQTGERPVPTLNKFCKMYVQGFDGAKELRENLMAADSVPDLLQKLRAALNESS